MFYFVISSLINTAPVINATSSRKWTNLLRCLYRLNPSCDSVQTSTDKYLISNSRSASMFYRKPQTKVSNIRHTVVVLVVPDTCLQNPQPPHTGCASDSHSGTFPIMALTFVKRRSVSGHCFVVLIGRRLVVATFDWLPSDLWPLASVFRVGWLEVVAVKSLERCSPEMCTNKQ